MYTEQALRDALQYFTMPNHPNSFELLDGGGMVMLSAPHAVVQTRNGRIKQAERYTGMLCRLIHQRRGCPCIYKARHMQDDANYDEFSPYRDSLCEYIRLHSVRCLLDLHQLAPDRPMDLCIGTGHGANLCGNAKALEVLKQAFATQGFEHITVDDPFSASGKHTVSASVAAACGITTVQLELNTRLLSEDSPDECFMRVMSAIEDAIQRLSQMRM